MKRAHVGRAAFDPSKTVPVSDVNLAPQPAQRHLLTPDGSRPSLHALPPPAPGARRVGPEELGGLGEGAETQLVAAEPLVERGGQKGEPVGVQGRHEAGVGVLPLHISLSHPPRRPPSGVVAKR